MLMFPFITVATLPSSPWPAITAITVKVAEASHGLGVPVKSHIG